MREFSMVKKSAPHPARAFCGVQGPRRAGGPTQGQDPGRVGHAVQAAAGLAPGNQPRLGVLSAQAGGRSAAPTCRWCGASTSYTWSTRSTLHPLQSARYPLKRREKPFKQAGPLTSALE